MAIDLKASISLVDKMTAPMRKMTSQLNNFKNATASVNRGVGEMRSSMGGFTSGLAATATGILGVVGAQKLLNSTIGEAMKLDYNKVSLQAMFRGDADAANELSKFIQDKALNSVMTYQDALSSTQSFSALTKNTDQIKEMVNLSERLSYLNPMESFEGAGFAIKEALGGDMVSLKDRFNLTSDQIAPIKEAASQVEKLKALDKVLADIGIDTQYLGEVNDTTYAKWGKLVDSTKQFLKGLGESALTSVGPFIDKLTAFMEGDKFANFQKNAEDAFGAAISGAINLATKIAENWPAIKETTISIGAGFVAMRAAMIGLTIVSTITAMMNAYKAATVGATIAQTLLNGVLLANPIGLVVAAIGLLVAAGVFLYRNWDTVKAKTIELWNKLGFLKGAVLALLGPFGSIVGAGVAIYQNFDTIKSKAGTMVNSVISGVNRMIGVLNKIPGVNIPIVPKVNWGNITSAPQYSAARGQGRQTSHAGGLSRVPYDGYAASLHRGERVLTKQENKSYSSGKGGGNTYNFGGIHINGSGSTEKDADRLFDLFVKKVEAAGNGGV